MFDGTLRQGLAVQLEQTPFLSLISEERVQQTLRLMGQPADARLTPEIARELCQRAGSSVVLDGSIAEIGAQYSLILRAVNCSNGESLTSTEAQASDKSHVLGALSRAASEIRAKLGESLSTIRRFDTSLEQATTPSLEALQAYSLGLKSLVRLGDDAAAVPFFQRAIQLDSRFAEAYEWLSAADINLGETDLAAENAKKSYELRERVSEREKLSIESTYHFAVTGDLEKDYQSFQLYAQTFPRDWAARNGLALVYDALGQPDKALASPLRLNPASNVNYSNVISGLLRLNRLEEAHATAADAQAKGLDSPDLRFVLYQLAFLHDDKEAMGEQVTWSAGKPGVEDVLLYYEADTNAYFGHLKTAREFSRRAVASAERTRKKETAAGYEAEAALREALFGNAAGARQRAKSALGFSSGRLVQFGAALALAFAGDGIRARALSDDLDKRFPENTLVRFNYLPTLRGQLALIHGDSSKAIEALQIAVPYELGSQSQSAFAPALYSIYVRGEAYLAAHQGSEAAAEFKKVLEHRGIALNLPIGVLAHLGLARAYAMQGDTTKAKAAYQDFLTLWKDADPDIPILIAAKAEYAKL
jgi:Flp pilus assembly protein TadD